MTVVMRRKVGLWVAASPATVILILVGVMTALWISVGGTFFRGEQVTVATFVQIGFGVVASVGLGSLVVLLIRAALKK